MSPIAFLFCFCIFISVSLSLSIYPSLVHSLACSFSLEQQIVWDLCEFVFFDQSTTGSPDYALPRVLDFMRSQFGHDHVLCLVGTGLAGKVDDVRLVHLLVLCVQLEGLEEKGTHLYIV